MKMTRPSLGLPVSSTKRAFAQSKLSMSLDFIFGPGIGKRLNFENLDYQISRKTGRLRYVLDRPSGEILFTFRANGSIAPTISGARKILLSEDDDAIKSGNNKKRKKKKAEEERFVVTVLDGVSDFVAEGKTVFCKHVVSANDKLHAGEDVVVLNQRGELLGVGKSVLPGELMKQFKRGVAVKMRAGVRSKGNGTASSVL